nr:hypothetical protein GCM10025730_10360 [Promicromonospora thailandica]
MSLDVQYSDRPESATTTLEQVSTIEGVPVTVEDAHLMALNQIIGSALTSHLHELGAVGYSMFVSPAGWTPTSTR